MWEFYYVAHRISPSIYQTFCIQYYEGSKQSKELCLFLCRDASRISKTKIIVPLRVNISVRTSVIQAIFSAVYILAEYLGRVHRTVAG